jgi:hypothetical protein
MNLLLYGLFAGFWIIGLIVMIEGLQNATEACEDDDGFHDCGHSREPKHSFEIALNHRSI